MRSLLSKKQRWRDKSVINDVIVSLKHSCGKHSYDIFPTIKPMVKNY